MLTGIALWTGSILLAVIALLLAAYLILVIGCRRAVEFHYGSDDPAPSASTWAPGPTREVDRDTAAA